jgi:Na+/H+ antiporter NhaD/arsenite permease-like protein
MQSVWIALAIFLVTYALISIRRFPKIHIDRAAAALIGAALMIVFGVVKPGDVMSAINLDILFLLIGMMLLVAGLELCGFFEWVSLRMIKYSKNQFSFLVLTMVVTGTLSALVLNDTIVLLFTPIIIRTCRILKSNPVPFLVAEAISANIGSVATEVGNPQNAYVATTTGISFVDFSAKLVPVSIVCMLVAIAIIYIVYRKDIEKGSAQEFRKRINAGGWKRFEEELVNGDETSASCYGNLRKRKIALLALLLITGGTFAGFIANHVLGASIAVIALVGGVLALFVAPLLSDVKSKDMLSGVDWSIILFFVGLFIVIQGVRESSLLNDVKNFFPGFGDGHEPTIPWLTALSALLSNLVSNVPAVLLLGALIPVSHSQLWIALASSSTLAGNATILGAAANVIVAEKAESKGVEINFWKFTLVGFPIAIVTLLISTLMLMVLF